MNFHFTSLSVAGTVASVQHAMLMSGDGKWDAQGIEGGGAYNHFDDASPAPKPILDQGKWEATRLLSWNSVGAWGVQTAGALGMGIIMKQELPSPATIEAQLQLVCNVGPGKLYNPNPNPPPANLPEGFTLTIPGNDYGAYVPSQPPLGLTFFNSGERVEDRALVTAQADLRTYLPIAVAVPSLVAAGLGLALIRTKSKSANDAPARK
jgi:hypothetical protein